MADAKFSSEFCNAFLFSKKINVGSRLQLCPACDGIALDDADMPVKRLRHGKKCDWSRIRHQDKGLRTRTPRRLFMISCFKPKISLYVFTSAELYSFNIHAAFRLFLANFCFSSTGHSTNRACFSYPKSRAPKAFTKFTVWIFQFRQGFMFLIARRRWRKKRSWPGGLI